jgi:glycosyltransferase involved in cell wall biosynthesis
VKVVQLIPYDGIGGVEEAARSMNGASRGGTVFSLSWIFPRVTSASRRWATHNPFRIVIAGVRIARQAPDVLIVSLWRAATAGIITKLFAPRIKLVLFIHNSKDAHLFDFIFTRVAAWFADAIWADSETAVQKRFRNTPKRPVTVISYLIRRIAPLDTCEGAVPRPVFAFWGRLAAQKNLSRALGIFGHIAARHPDAEFRIIGPDGGEEEMLRASVAAMGLQANVKFLGALPFSEISAAVRGASFYLQTSKYEGMSVSVTEAMQMGLVPVVTPVGEIERYCRCGVNAVIIHEETQAAEELLAILDALRTYSAMRRKALATWKTTPLYEDSVFAAVEDLLAV